MAAPFKCCFLLENVRNDVGDIYTGQEEKTERTQDITQLPAWACPAGRIRLLARQQARESAVAAQDCAANLGGGATPKDESVHAPEQLVAKQANVDVSAEALASVDAHKSIARTKAVLAEFEILQSKLLKWA